MLDFTPVTDRLGDAGAAILVGALVGALFGSLAQRSRFCLRAAVHEVARTEYRGRLGLWLAAVGAAIAATQLLTGAGLIDTFAVRALNEGPSLSGALLGGLLFGGGMMLANGCASRHLVLAGTGNLRALVVFALFAITAAATIQGPLAPLQQVIAGAWRLESGAGNALSAMGHGASTGIAAGAGVLAIGLWLAVRANELASRIAAGLGVGLVIALGWYLTTALSRHTFDPTPVESAAFTAPAAHVAALIVAPGKVPLGFDTGFLPAVLLGAFVTALWSREFRVAWFPSVALAARYAVGAALMGFGGVLAIGCSVGGLANASVMITASMVALLAMWAGALATDRVMRFDWSGLVEGYRETAARARPELVSHHVAES